LQPAAKEEMRKFVGLLAWIGLVQFPTIADCWSKIFLYKNEEAPNATSMKQFEPLL
jgi:hypothetical protein